MNPRFVFIADTHHFSRTLSDGGEAYAYRSESDQKCLEETGEIIDAAFEKILEDPPAAVMIAGDLSDDGERICHEEFREKLRELQKHVPVYVITATHDWCCDENPRRFTGDEVTNDVETVPHEELSEFYREFGHMSRRLPTESACSRSTTTRTAKGARATPPTTWRGSRNRYARQKRTVS